MSEAPSPLLFSYRLPTGRSYLGVVVKRAYRMPLRGVAAPLTEAPPVRLEPVWADSQSAPGTRWLVHDSDRIAPAKPATDVLLLGSAWARRGEVRALEVGLEVGPVRKAIRVEGDRRVERAPGGGLRFEQAEGFTRLPLTWERAYGGRDGVEERRRWPAARGRLDPRAAAADEEPHGMLVYPRNYAGRGYLTGEDAGERVVGALAPNLEDPARPLDPGRFAIPELMDWIDGPVPACFAPIDVFTFPRALFVLRPDFRAPRGRLVEIEAGAIGEEDLAERASPMPSGDPRAYLCAPPGLCGRRLTGGERVRLWNLHRESEEVEFELPGERPALELGIPGVGVRALEARLATVLLEPDEDRVTLTWGGALEAAMVFPEEALGGIEVVARFPR